MYRPLLHKASIAELIAMYRDAADRESGASDVGNHEVANPLSDLLREVYDEVRHRGPEAQEKLLPLLSDDSPGVRLWAASHALEFAPELAEPVLTALRPVGTFIGLNATTTLKEWRRGLLEFQNPKDGSG